MEQLAPVIVSLALFAVLGAVVLGPIGRAFAERLRGKGREPALDSAEVEALRDELSIVRQQLGELAERQDFTERLLGQVKERGLLNAPKER
ncbi:MAG: hypothetical protein ABSG61_09835 [Gemmatimonadales bacterium]